MRNVKVLGNYLMKARQKTKPKYAARYLVRVLFPKETLLCSIMGVSARGRRTLDPNKIAAIRGIPLLKMHRFTFFFGTCQRFYHIGVRFSTVMISIVQQLLNAVVDVLCSAGLKFLFCDSQCSFLFKMDKNSAFS